MRRAKRLRPKNNWEHKKRHSRRYELALKNVGIAMRLCRNRGIGLEVDDHGRWVFSHETGRGAVWIPRAAHLFLMEKNGAVTYAHLHDFRECIEEVQRFFSRKSLLVNLKEAKEMIDVGTG